MTKARTPVTVEDAAYRVIGSIGMDAAVAATGRKADYLRSLTDPDKRFKLTVEDAVKLDLAHVAGGYEGTPIYATYGLLIDTAFAERFSDRHRFAHLVASFVKEAGEAGYASIKASLPGATPADDREAEREMLEAVEAAKVLLAYFNGRRSQAPP